MSLKSACFFSSLFLLPTGVFAQPCNLAFNASMVQAVACTQRDVTLTCTAIPGATYVWKDPASTVISNTQNASLTGLVLANTGNYTVTATVGSCVYNAAVFVDVKITPTPIKPIVSYNGPKCVGEDITLQAFTGGAAGIVYYWHGPNSYSSTQQSPVLANIQTNQKGNYSVFAVSGEGCVTDTSVLFVDVHPEVKTDFDFNITLGCKEDKVDFINKSTGDTASLWSFGDGTTDISKSPTHSYTQQPQTYTVKLVSSNRYCKDSLIKLIAINHPLKAAYTVDKDSICQRNTINFTDASTFTIATAPTYFWDFGDGATDNNNNTTHTYDKVGVYNAMMIIKDFLGCEDTAYHTIVVDSTGAIVFAPEQDNLCAGQFIKFSGYYNPIFCKEAIWNMGDGNIIKNTSDVVHAYDKPGTYTITFKASYRLCPDTTFSGSVTILPHPVIDLGPDRKICPYGEPVVLKDLINAGDPKAKWNWNSDVINNSPQLTVYHPGVFAATVDINGCKATDTVEVIKDCYINIPNAFTPNGDGNDDYFLPRELLSKGVSKFHMTIFNRWGQKVFETTSTNGRGWDGKFNGEDQPLGVYLYLVEASFINNTQEKYQGNLTLIR